MSAKQVFCPECHRTGQRSTFESDGASSSTLMGGSRMYYDEDGNQHYHEVNTSTSYWWCSNGHRFVRRSIPRCPSCGYGSESWNLLPPEPPKPMDEPEYLTFNGIIRVPSDWDDS